LDIPYKRQKNALNSKKQNTSALGEQLPTNEFDSTERGAQIVGLFGPGCAHYSTGVCKIHDVPFGPRTKNTLFLKPQHSPAPCKKNCLAQAVEQ